MDPAAPQVRPPALPPQALLPGQRELNKALHSVPPTQDNGAGHTHSALVDPWRDGRSGQRRYTPQETCRAAQPTSVPCSTS